MSQTHEVTRGGDVSISRVVRRMGAVLSQDAAPLLLLGVLLVGLPTLVYGVLRVTGVVASPGDDVVAAFRGAPGETLVTSLLTVFFTGALTHAALARFGGRPATFAEMLRAGGRLFPPLFGISFLTTLGIGLGLILLIVPGLILMSMWAVATPARVAGPPGVMAAIERSAKLTEGQRWRVFGLIVLASLLFLAASVLLGSVGMLLDETVGGRPLATELVANPLIQVLTAFLMTLLPAALYEELRSIKEGPHVDLVADVFA